MLFNAGAHVPVMPLVEVVGSGASTAPEQIGTTAAKVGVMLGLTVMVSVVVVAHCPAAGVNVYELVPIVAVLMAAGFQVPVIPFVDEVGNTGAVEF